MNIVEADIKDKELDKKTDINKASFAEWQVM